jgi:hypothetical protein
MQQSHTYQRVRSAGTFVARNMDCTHFTEPLLTGAPLSCCKGFHTRLVADTRLECSRF